MDYMFRIRLRKPAEMPAAEFYRLWLEEAEPSLLAIESGAMSIYKVAGADEAVGIMSVESIDQLDAIYDLPMWASGHSHIVESVEWVPLRSHADWVDDLKRLSARA
jgi:muconolactone delta-isomerase